MSAQEPEFDTDDRAPSGRVIGGYLAAIAIFAGLTALVYYPARIGPGAIVVALVAAGLGTTVRGLDRLAMLVAGGGFLFGMIIAVTLGRPIF